ARGAAGTITGRVLRGIVITRVDGSGCTGGVLATSSTAGAAGATATGDVAGASGINVGAGDRPTSNGRSVACVSLPNSRDGMTVCVVGAGAGSTSVDAICGGCEGAADTSEA